MFNKTILIAVLFTSLNLLGFEYRSTYSAIRSPNSSLGEGPQFYLENITVIGAEQKAFIQFYIQVNYNELQFVRDEDYYRANYHLEVQVYDSNDELLDLQSQTDVVKVSTYQETLSSHIARVSRYSISLEPADYRISVYITDLETKSISQISRTFAARDFRGKNLMTSDIQLSHNMSPAQNGQPFSNEHWYIEPNLSRTFSPSTPAIYCYFELYHLPVSTGQSSLFTLEFRFYNSNGKEIGSFRRRFNAMNANLGVNTKLSSHWFDAGEYLLVVDIKEDLSGETVRVSKKFKVIN